MGPGAQEPTRKSRPSRLFCSIEHKGRNMGPDLSSCPVYALTGSVARCTALGLGKHFPLPKLSARKVGEAVTP